jgi:hypothetical protein
MPGGGGGGHGNTNGAAAVADGLKSPRVGTPGVGGTASQARWSDGRGAKNSIINCEIVPLQSRICPPPHDNIFRVESRTYCCYASKKFLEKPLVSTIYIFDA